MLSPAVSTPMTCPVEVLSGPPESPGTMPALIWIMPCKVSVLSAAASSEAVMVLSSPVTCPPAGMMAPVPSALPSASTASPVLTAVELPIGTVCRPVAPCSRIKATSTVLS